MVSLLPWVTYYFFNKFTDCWTTNDESGMWYVQVVMTQIHVNLRFMFNSNLIKFLYWPGQETPRYCSSFKSFQLFKLNVKPDFHNKRIATKCNTLRHSLFLSQFTTKKSFLKLHRFVKFALHWRNVLLILFSLIFTTKNDTFGSVYCTVQFRTKLIHLNKQKLCCVWVEDFRL